MEEKGGDWLMAVLQHHDYRNKDNQDNDGSEDYKNLTSLLLGSHHAHITKTDVEEEQNLDDIIYSSKCQVGAWFPAKLKSPPLQAQVSQKSVGFKLARPSCMYVVSRFYLE